MLTQLGRNGDEQTKSELVDQHSETRVQILALLLSKQGKVKNLSRLPCFFEMYIFEEILMCLALF